MLKLNFALYTGQTLLKNFWPEIKRHFTQVQEAHNDLEQTLTASIAAEAQARKNAIANEKAAREDADTQLKNADARLNSNMLAKAEELYEAIKEEAKDRLDADTGLSSNISAEQRKRESQYKGLTESISEIGKLSHTHTNLSVLQRITEDDIEALRDRMDYNKHNALVNEYLEDVCRGLSTEIRKIYAALGVTLYDGGIDGEEQTGPTLDGGGFDEDNQGSVDCQSFDSDIFAVTAVVDGGQY